MKHEYTEGCVCTSYYVNDKPFRDLTIDEMKSAIQELLNNTLDIGVLQDVWIMFLERIGEYEDLGYCGQCGDSINKYTINIK